MKCICKLHNVRSFIIATIALQCLLDTLHIMSVQRTYVYLLENVLSWSKVTSCNWLGLVLKQKNNKLINILLCTGVWEVKYLTMSEMGQLRKRLPSSKSPGSLHKNRTWTDVQNESKQQHLRSIKTKESTLKQTRGYLLMDLSMFE
jgi:hypothetical protein